MKVLSDNPAVSNMLIVIVMISIAVGDFVSTGHLLVSALYVTPIIMAGYLASPKITRLYIAAAVILTLLGLHGVNLQEEAGRYTLANRSLVMFLILSCGLVSLKIQKAEHEKENLRELVTMCAWTKKVKVDGQWISIEEFLAKYYHIDITHGITEDVAQRLIKESTVSNVKPKRTEVGPVI